MLAGRATIAAFGAEGRFEAQNVGLVDAMTRGMVMVDATSTTASDARGRVTGH